MFLAATIDEPLCKHFELIRCFGQLEAMTQGHWDTKIFIAEGNPVLDDLARLAKPILENQPVIPRLPPRPSFDKADYDAIAIVDASGAGYGAYASLGEEVFSIRKGWESRNQHSAHAEPMGATEIVRWIKRRLPKARRIAVVTDHIALAMGQRRPTSGNRGFAKAYYLNEFFMEIYANTQQQIDVFYVEGSQNIADAPSRDVVMGAPWQERRELNMTLPPLNEFFHPFEHPFERPWWNV
jgi:hypothetical protein